MMPMRGPRPRTTMLVDSANTDASRRDPSTRSRRPWIIGVVGPLLRLIFSKHIIHESWSARIPAIDVLQQSLRLGWVAHRR